MSPTTLNAVPLNLRFLHFLLVASLFMVTVKLGMLPPLLCGLLSYSLVLGISALTSKGKRHSHTSKMVGLVSIAALVSFALFVVYLGCSSFVRNSNGLIGMLARMSDILLSVSGSIPSEYRHYFPDHPKLVSQISDWLKHHAYDLSSIGLGAIKTIGYCLLGVLLGSMIAVTSTNEITANTGKHLTGLRHQVAGLRDAFLSVAAAQLPISLLNTVVTAVFLEYVLPHFFTPLPFSSALIVLTFAAGLLPVIGNLISNTAITIIALSQSTTIALICLLYLVVAHKAEYFVNAKLMGTRIQAATWELLLSMLIFERLFGPIGVVASPIFLAWLKVEWASWDRPDRH
jgi:predicted PurR-regulated permease PerM